MNFKRLFLSVSAILILLLFISSCSNEGEKQQTIKPVNVKMVQAEFNVSGMTCSGCVKTIEETLQKVDGVKTTEVNLEKEDAVVTYDANKTTVAELQKVVAKVGYEIELKKN